MNTPNTNLHRSVMWAPWEDQGLEHLQLTGLPDGVSADGVIIRAKDGAVFRAHYRVRCDEHWRVREARVSGLDGGKSISLASDGRGNWATDEGERLSYLDYCLDVDISATPFTNTLPIRRLDLKEGESEEIVVLYIALPEIETESARQKYTCLWRSADGGLYRYESLSSGFTVELPVDSDGLVTDYPFTFRRAWPR